MRFPTGIAPEDRCLDGHFPGDPVVPAAALLGEAAAALRAEGFAVTGLRRAKFVRALRPGEPFEIAVTHAPGRATLRWRSGDALLAEASVLLAEDDG